MPGAILAHYHKLLWETWLLWLRKKTNAVRCLKLPERIWHFIPFLCTYFGKHKIVDIIGKCINRIKILQDCPNVDWPTFRKYPILLNTVSMKKWTQCNSLPNHQQMETFYNTHTPQNKHKPTTNKKNPNLTPEVVNKRKWFYVVCPTALHFNFSCAPDVNWWGFPLFLSLHSSAVLVQSLLPSRCPPHNSASDVN